MTEIDKFGHGILFPCVRDGKGDFANAGEITGLLADISMLLGIIGPGIDEPGELPFNTDLGSRIVELKHRQIHSELTDALAQQYTGEAIRRWDSTVRVGRTKTKILDEDTNQNMLEVKTEIRPLGHTNTENPIVVSHVPLEE